VRATRQTPLAVVLAVVAAFASAVSAEETTSDAAAAPSPARFVITVGYNGGPSDERRPLQYADDDAARFHALQQSAEKTWLLTTFDVNSASLFAPLTQVAQQPTKQMLSRVLGEATWSIREAKRQGRPTELVFFFAGHGDVSADGEGFVVLADGVLTKRELETQVVVASPADINHIVIDACASYLMVARGEATAAPIPLTPEMLAKLDANASTAAAWDRTGVFVSTSSAAEVHETAALGGGVFSFLLRSALVGGGDVNADGRVEYGEAQGFVAAASAAIHDPRAKLDTFVRPPKQRPHVSLSTLATLPAASYLWVEPGARSAVSIFDSHGVPYASTHSEPDASTYVALVGHPFFWVQMDDEEALLIPRHAGAYAMSSLSFAPATQARGHDTTFDLFAVPYGKTFMQGFLAQSTVAAPAATTSAVSLPIATDGHPPWRIPWGMMSGVAGATGAVLLVGAGASAVANAVAFAQLRQRFETSGTLDPELALQADGFMTGAVFLSIAGGALLTSSVGLAWIAIQEDE